eukprot:3163895-Prymnesium_polylepis.2
MPVRSVYSRGALPLSPSRSTRASNTSFEPATETPAHWDGGMRLWPASPPAARPSAVSASSTRRAGRDVR